MVYLYEENRALSQDLSIYQGKSAFNRNYDLNILQLNLCQHKNQNSVGSVTAMRNRQEDPWTQWKSS